MANFTYRGHKYNTNDRDGSKVAKTLTYRGNAYASIQPITGSCRKVKLQETYRGVKHEETKTVCA
jgi:hypothetical protein